MECRWKQIRYIGEQIVTYINKQDDIVWTQMILNIKSYIYVKHGWLK